MRILVPLLAALFLCFVPGSPAAQPSPFGAGRGVTVMSRNLYLGADLAPVFAAATPAAFLAAVTATFASVQATDFPERAAALAAEIAATRPDLVGLQEVALWRSGPADGSPSPNATTVEYDFLQRLLDALDARGLRYAAHAVAIGMDVEAPRQTSTGLQDIRFTDRDVILARTDLDPADLAVGNVQVGTFAAHVTVPHPVAGPIPIVRSWAALDARVRGFRFRFVTTHLEASDGTVQVLQAEELLQGPAHGPGPVLLVGDFNSRADGTGTATYGRLIAAGFVDAWTRARPGEPGPTCCQAANLLNPTSALTERIDLALSRPGFDVLGVALVGEELADLTPSGL